MAVHSDEGTKKQLPRGFQPRLIQDTARFCKLAPMSRTTVRQRPALSYASCSVGIAPLRAESRHSSEQVSQLLFGERVEILELRASAEWVCVRCAWDGYEAWCKSGQLQPVSLKDFRRQPRVISIAHGGRLIMENGEMQLPMGAELTRIKGSLVPVMQSAGRFRGRKLSLADAKPEVDILIEAARSYLHAPYQWGGRGLDGIDCSGLMQQAFKCIGIPLLRDASMQATMGEEVHFLAEARPGDLAFFDNDEGRITHVGILSQPGSIIHATDTSGRVVEDRIDNAGIISITLKKRTHNLRTIRRIVPVNSPLTGLAL